jgi:EAL domain-containing protein (putative c-di-GMP-specific phosphodiesterase class I)
MQELEQVHLNYIRIHKDYTNNIDHEREVIIRNIINFANLQNVKILGDIISNKHDYEIAKKLRFYGTSR